jgi:SHS family lactate transporter-like MFS transporter
MRAFNDDDITDVKNHHHAVVEGNLEEVATNQIPQRKALAAEQIERV